MAESIYTVKDWVSTTSYSKNNIVLRREDIGTTGSYVNDNWETIDCENDSWDGGWTKIFTYHGEQQYGDKGIIYG